MLFLQQVCLRALCGWQDDNSPYSCNLFCLFFFFKGFLSFNVSSQLLIGFNAGKLYNNASFDYLHEFSIFKAFNIYLMELNLFFFQKRINACFTHWLHGITNPSMWIHRETGSTIEGGSHFVSPHGPWCGRRPLTVSLCKYTRHPTTICLVCKASRDLSSMLTFLTRGLGTLCVPSGGRWPRQPG